MLVLNSVGELFLYLFTSILMGAILLPFLPGEKRPEFQLSKGVLGISCLGIIIGSFFQPLQVILAFYKEVGLLISIKSILFNFVVGKGWLMLVCCVLFLYPWLKRYILEGKKEYRYAVIFAMMGLLFSIGWTSHAASIDGVRGGIIHGIHFMAVTSWIGILFVSSWFSKPMKDWSFFLRWYTPVAISCLVMTIGTGIFLMSLVVNVSDYVNAWQLTYGQVLLIKHVLFIPLLSFAVINGIFIRKKLKEIPSFQPTGWFRAESIIGVLIFTATSFLGKTSPPHDILTTLEIEGQARLFQVINGGVSPTDHLSLQLNFTSISLSLLTILFITITLLGFKKGMSWAFSFVFALLSGVTFYLGLMLSLS